MPYGQPADADQQFFSDFNVSWTFDTGASPAVATIVAPPGVQVVRINTGLYQIILPGSYIAQLNSNGTPITSADFFTSMPGSSVGGTDAPFILRYLPTAVGTDLALGTFMFAAAPLATPTGPADVTNANVASVLCKLKFATVLVLPA